MIVERKNRDNLKNVTAVQKTVHTLKRVGGQNAAMVGVRDWSLARTRTTQHLATYSPNLKKNNLVTEKKYGQLFFQITDDLFYDDYRRKYYKVVLLLKNIN